MAAESPSILTSSLAPALGSGIGAEPALPNLSKEAVIIGCMSVISAVATRSAMLPPSDVLRMARTRRWTPSALLLASGRNATIASVLSKPIGSTAGKVFSAAAVSFAAGRGARGAAGATGAAGAAGAASAGLVAGAAGASACFVAGASSMKNEVFLVAVGASEPSYFLRVSFMSSIMGVGAFSTAFFCHSMAFALLPVSQ